MDDVSPVSEIDCPNPQCFRSPKFSMHLARMTVLMAAMSIHGSVNAHSEYASAERHSAHVHGAMVLTVALEGDALEIELRSPAVNIVGFEHKATSVEQKQQLTAAETMLSSADQVFQVTGANCVANKVKVDMSALQVLDQGDHQDSHDHKTDHKHHDESGVHSEITVLYRFKCENSEGLKDITVNLFHDFPGVEKIDVQWITDAKQGAVELKPLSNKISVR